LPFGGKLLQGGKLPERDRELAILRTAHRCAARYEWAQHVGIGRLAGLTDEEILRVADDETGGWDDGDSTLVSAVDEIVATHRVSDGTWSRLASRYDTEQLIELPMLVGHYAMLAGVLGTLGVEPDSPELPALGQV